MTETKIKPLAYWNCRQVPVPLAMALVSAPGEFSHYVSTGHTARFPGDRPVGMNSARIYAIRGEVLVEAGAPVAATRASTTLIWDPDTGEDREVPHEFPAFYAILEVWADRGRDMNGDNERIGYALLPGCYSDYAYRDSPLRDPVTGADVHAVDYYDFDLWGRD